MADSKRWVWVPDTKNLFARAIILEENGDTMKVRVEDTGETKDIRASAAEKVNPAQFNQVGDMAELTYLNEPSVVNNLSSRWHAGKIYTYSGLFLVAVNPYKPLPIYGDEVASNFKNKRRDEAEPHIYAIADQAFRSMLETRRDQSILITGESGAGKTENTKKAIQYLSSVTNSKSAGSIDERILQTNPILEAFGNAQTIRNANSSRFGKFIKIQFGHESKGISGASIQWYLLEKSRVVTQHANERNYHVFYQLLSGAPPELKRKLGLPEKASHDMYTYLASGVPTIEGVDDAQLYTRLVEAFSIMGFSMPKVEEIFQMVASVLLLGQIKYRASSADQGTVINMADVEAVCKLLGVDAESFVRAVTQPRVKVGREFTTQSRTASQAQHTTNAVAKALYERLFGYIVEQLNSRLGKANPSACSIGVLDIAGFEIFETNSFEQLCINYTNEKLQQFFNHHMFVLEQEEYVKENVDWDYIDYGSDLQPTIDLIEQSKNPMGIFSCLNEESVLPSGSDASFNEKLVKQWKDENAKFSPSRLGQGFKIAHYAQTVEYDTDGWIEKNKDPLSDVVETLLSESRNGLVKTLFTTAESSKLKGKASLFRTVAQRHKEQLGDLMMHLEATQPHFVRCIIPNTQRSPSTFDNHLVLNQLRYNGVLEGIRIARSGFPNRLEFAAFSQRYRALAGHSCGPLDSQQTSASILQQIGLDTSLYKVGLSKIFFRNGVLAELEHRLEKLIAEQTVFVQSFSRGAISRINMRRELHRRRAAKMIASCFRISNRHAADPWWQFNSGLKPLLMSKEGMDSSKKDLRMQKLESSLHRLKEEQVELISSKNELRGELIAVLKSKEELAQSLENAVRNQKEREEAHELAVTAARSRDEASSAALLELGKKHNTLREEYEELQTAKEQQETALRAEWEKKLDQAKQEHDSFKSTHTETTKQLESLQTQLSDISSTHESDISGLKASQALELKKLNEALEQAQLKLQEKDNRICELEEKEKRASSSKADEIVAIQASLTASETQFASLKESHSSEVSKLESELTTLRTALKELKGSHEEKARDLTSAHSMSQDIQAKLDKSTAEVTKLREWLGKAKTELKSAASANRELSDLQEKHKVLKETTEAERENTLREAKLAKQKVTELESQLKGQIGSDKYETVAAENKKLTRDLDIATDNLLKTSEELTQAKSEVKDLRQRLDKVASELSDAKKKLKSSDFTVSELRGAVSKAEASSQTNDNALSSLRKELATAKALASEKSSEVANLTRVKDSLESKVADLQSRVAELRKTLSAHDATAAADTAKLTATVKELSDTKAELLQLRTQTPPPSGTTLTSFQRRFGTGTLEQEIEDRKQELAEATAKIEDLRTSLDTSRKENAKYIILQQKYEKLQREKAKLAQDRSHLILGSQASRGQSRELEIAKARAAEVKRLESELNVLRLKLVRSERDRRALESRVGNDDGKTSTSGGLTEKNVLHRLRLLEIEKLQLSKAVQSLSSQNPKSTSEKRDDDVFDLGISSADKEDHAGLSKFASLSISDVRSVSDQTRLAAEQAKTGDLEEAVEVYKRRANEFHSKLEKAELVVESALRAEQTAKKQVDDYKLRLKQVEEDHSSEVADFHREMLKTKRQLESRDAEIEDLAMKANFSNELQSQVKSLNSTLKELSVERDRLAKDKARLEKRLHDMVLSYEHQPRKLEEQLVSLKQNEQQMMREHGELRWKLERKARHVDQLRRSLTDADARIEQCRSEIDRLQANESAREIELRRAHREISETHERYLMAERELEQYRVSRRSLDRKVDNRPAFV